MIIMVWTNARIGNYDIMMREMTGGVSRGVTSVAGGRGHIGFGSLWNFVSWFWLFFERLRDANWSFTVENISLYFFFKLESLTVKVGV